MEKIINYLNLAEEEIINKLSLKEKEDKKIKLEEVDILLKIAKMIELAINSLKEKNDLL